MNDTTLLSNEDTKALENSVNRFVQQHLSEYCSEWRDNRAIPKSYFRQLGDAGYLGADLPEIYGGSDAGFSYSAELIKAFCRAGHLVDGGMLIAQQLTVAHMLNSPHVSAKIKDRYLPPLISGEFVPALAITESQGGSDILGTVCEAKSDGDRYLINGSKTFISNANIADFFILAARTSPIEQNRKGLTLFLVDADTPGIEIGKPLHKTGMHAADTAELFFTDLAVSDQQIVGQVDQALTLLAEGLPRERCYAALCSGALCEWALGVTREHVKERHLFGKPISHMQNTRFELAQMYTDWRLLDAFLDQVVEKMHHNRLDSQTASIARLKGVQTVMEIAEKCALLFGGYGFMAEYPIAQLWSDVRGMAFWGGPNEAMKEIIGRQFLSE